MQFEREHVEVALNGLRYYGIIIALVAAIVAAVSIRQEARAKGKTLQDYRRAGAIVLIGCIVLAVGWFILLPEDGPRIQIRYYGIIIVAAMLIATAVAANLAKRTGRDPEHVYGALTWAIIPGIIVSRLWFVLFPPQTLVEMGQDRAFYLENFFNLNHGAIAIWSGGLSIFGAIIGGLLGFYIYMRRNNLSVGPWLDIAAVVLPLAQAIGRWANWVNQELYGVPTELPWGITIARENLIERYRAIEFFDARYHPLFLYESLWGLVAFGVLLYLYNNYRSRFRAGDFFLLYVAQYSVIRFLLEFLRVEVTMVGDINLSQLVTGAAFVIAVLLLIYRHRSGAPTEYETTAKPAAAPKAPPPSEEPQTSENV
jgi:phosphatidylglycerol---prolipoprotein diacylglyceryl transferase